MSRNPIPNDALDDRLGIVKSRASLENRGTPRRCIICGEVFAPHRRREEARCCSPHCVWAANKGPEFNAKVARESAAARGDKQRGRGEGKTYRKLNGRHEHRVVAEQKLGRPLAYGEVVHHADETKLNNQPENLEVLASQAEHARLHFKGSKQSPEHVRKRVEARRNTIERRKILT